jgi:hypothetical protein
MFVQIFFLAISLGVVDQLNQTDLMVPVKEAKLLNHE